MILRAGLEKSHTAQQAVSQKGKGRKRKNDGHVIKQLLTEVDRKILKALNHDTRSLPHLDCG